VLRLEKIFLKDIMIKDPYTIDVHEPFGLVWDIFRLRKVRHLPILINDRMLVGIITLTDLYRIISPQKTPQGNLLYDLAELNKYELKKEMTSNPVALAPDDTIGKAIAVMVEKKHGCVPIVDETNYLLGMVTKGIVLEAISKYFI
jgi:CBS domain-containing protein